MKRIKKVSAFISAVLIVSNCGYSSNAFGEKNISNKSDEIFNEENDSVTKLEISHEDSEILRRLKVSDKVYNGTKDAEIDFSDSEISSCDEIKLQNIIDGDEVYLEASAEFDSPDAGKYSGNVRVSFGLAGKDCDKYSFDSSKLNFHTTAEIKKAECIIVPDKNSNCIFTGDNVPSAVPFSLTDREGNEISSIDSSSVKLVPDVSDSSNAGKYSYKIINKNDRNLSLKIKKNSSFYIFERPDVKLEKVNFSDDDNAVTDYTVSIKAKNGNVFSLAENGDFSDSVSVNIKGDNSGEAVLFVKNDKDSSEISRAKLSFEKKESSYLSEKTSFAAGDNGSLKYYEPDGDKIAVTKNDLLITVEVRGCGISEDLSPELVNNADTEKKRYSSFSNKAYYDAEEKVYYYTYTYKIDDVAKDEEREFDLSLEYTDGFGKKESFKIPLYADGKKADKLVIDKLAPPENEKDISIKYATQNVEFYYNNRFVPTMGYFIAVGKVCDSGSGIAKIEYKWDKNWGSEAYAVYGINSHNGNINSHLGKAYFEADACNRFYKEADFSPVSFGRETEFQILVPYSESELTEDGKHHKLSLRITDNAGNIRDIEGKLYCSDNEGFDIIPPSINKDDVRIISGEKYQKIIESELTDEEMEAELDKIDDSDYVRMLESGNYAKGDIVLAVKASDVVDGTYSTGLKDFYVLTADKSENDKEVIYRNQINDYILESKENNAEENVFSYLSIGTTNKAFKNIIIGAFDANISKKNYISSLIDGMKSNDLIIDGIAPTVSADMSDAENEKDGVYWYNSGKISITATDEPGGIYRLNINNKDEADFKTSETREKKGEWIQDIAKCEQKVYNLKYFAEDNAGNLSDTFELSFGVDTTAPVCSAKPQEPEYSDSWYKEDTDFSVNINLTDELSGINCDNVTIKVNGQKIDFDEDFIVNDTDNKCVTYTLKKSVHLNNVPLDENDQCYHIEVEAKDYAGNSLADKFKYDIHIDRFDPWIDSVDAEKNNASENDGILNIYKYGIFANRGITLKIAAFDSGNKGYKKDSDFESRLNRIEITDEKGNILKTLTKGNIDDETYNYTIQGPPDRYFSNRIIITAYDNMGRSCSKGYSVRYSGNNTDIIETDVDETLNVILEDKAPDVEVTAPTPHYTEKSEQNEKGKYWFSGSKEEDIVFTVSDKNSGLRNVLFRDNEKNTVLDNYSTDNEINTSDVDNDDHTYIFKTNKSHDDSEIISGRHTINAEASDNAGNICNDGSYTYYVDDTVPEIKSVSFESEPVNINEGADKVISENDSSENDSINYGIFFSDEFKMHIYAEDKNDSSGLKIVNYKLVSSESDVPKEDIPFNSAEIKYDENNAPYAEVLMPKGFKGRIYAVVQDNVDNESGEFTLASAVITEADPPEIRMENSASDGKKDNNGNDLYNGDASVTVVISDMKSGLREWNVSHISEKYAQPEIMHSSLVRTDGGQWHEGDETPDGWKILSVEANLVTSVSKTFTFGSDDNDIQLIAEAFDNCGNRNDGKSKIFTIDTTAPIIEIQTPQSSNNSDYFNSKTNVTINVTERNFDPNLIKTNIENSYNGSIPSVSFTDDPGNPSRHTAVITFGEGDYSFDAEGTDLAGIKAEVIKQYDGRKRFYVDETAPVVKTNFASFGGKGENNYFNKSKKAVISVKEHNFDPDKTGIRVLRKDAGSEHNTADFDDSTYSFVSYSGWKQSPSDSDLYTLEFETDSDAVYKLEIAPVDKAGNSAVFDDSPSETEIYEIDKVKPVAVSKNGERVKDTDRESEFVDIYSASREDDEPPTIEFDDVNFDHLSYTVTRYVPDYSDGKEPEKIAVDTYTKEISGKTFVLDNFSEDGIYYVELSAYDKAGNISKLNKNSYIRMKNREVLAYIPDSSSESKTGLYSFEYADGTPVSKRPDNFSDIKITVMSETGKEPKIVLRDLNGDETDTGLKADDCNTDMYGVNVYNYTLKSEFFKTNYQNDTDKELILTVKNDGKRIDLGKIHIDNISPEVKIPEKFKSWKWYPGNKDRKIVLTDINEMLDIDLCKVYDNNKEIDFDYSEDIGTVSFVLEKGWHNVGIHLVDTAGNVYDMQEAENICVGNFWTWVIGGVTAAVGAAVGFILFRKRRRH